VPRSAAASEECCQEVLGEPLVILLVILSVSLDSDELKWKDFITQNEMSWPQYRDGGFEESVAKLGVKAIPPTFTIVKERRAPESGAFKTHQSVLYLLSIYTVNDNLVQKDKQRPAKSSPTLRRSCKSSSGGRLHRCNRMPSAVGATPRANLQPVSMCFSSQPGNKHVPRETREQKSRHRMDCLNRRRVVPADGKLSAEINREHPARQHVEHEPK